MPEQLGFRDTVVHGAAWATAVPFIYANVALGLWLENAPSSRWSFLLPSPGIDRATALGSSTGSSVVWNLGLFLAFVVQHSGMASRQWKRFVHAVMPAGRRFERTLYTCASAVAIVAFMRWWRPLPGVVWRVGSLSDPVLSLSFLTASSLMAIRSVGGIVACWATLSFDPLAFVGIRQLLKQEGDKKDDECSNGTAVELQTQGPRNAVCAVPLAVGPYAYCRHPMMTGMFLTLWATPVMSTGRLLFSSVLSAFALVAVAFHEEPRLAGEFDPGSYKEYTRQVPSRYFPGIL